MKIWQLLFGKPTVAASDSRFERAVARNHEAALNLENTMRDLLDENARLTLKGSPDAPNH